MFLGIKHAWQVTGDLPDVCGSHLIGYHDLTLNEEKQTQHEESLTLHKEHAYSMAISSAD